MPGLSVTAQIVTTDPPGSAFERLETGQLLELECEQLTVGAAAAISLPVGDGARADPVGMPITLLGYVAGVKRGRSVVIVHHQPWRGRLTIRFFPDGAGTRIVLESSLDQDGISWLANKRGFAPPEPPRSDRHRIGLLVSKSGPAAVFAQATETLAALAVEEINADGGIGGVLVDLVIGDDASDSAAGAATALRLVKSGCRAVFACVTSSTFNAAASALQNTGVLLVHTVLNEGGRSRPGVLRLGERPLDQTRAGIPAMMSETGSRTWFLVGQQYSWSFGAHWAARRVIAESTGSVAGEVYVPLGTTDFSRIIESIADSGAELILSTWWAMTRSSSNDNAPSTDCGPPRGRLHWSSTRPLSSSSAIPMPTESGRHSATFNPQPAITTSKSDTARARTNSCLRSVPCRRQHTKQSSLTHAQSNERRQAIRKQYFGSLSRHRKALRTTAFHCIDRFCSLNHAVGACTPALSERA